VLSTATVAVPPAINGVAALNVTLAGVVSSVALSLHGGLVLGQPGSAVLVVTALDAAGEPITGSLPFSAPIQLSSSSSALTLSTTTVTSPATVVNVAYNGTSDPTLHFTAQPPSGNAVTFSPFGNGTAGPVTVNPATVQVTVGAGPVTVAVGQSTPATGTIVLGTQCVAGAAIAVTPSSVPAGTTTTVAISGIAIPASPTSPACVITATGVAGQSATIDVDVDQNQVNVNAVGRR
jgi:hypothetical protein